eukprot:COSAG04_NODE_14844_length_553_cov_0.839207_2_plen_37_part_01
MGAPAMGVPLAWIGIAAALVGRGAAHPAGEQGSAGEQ